MTAQDASEFTLGVTHERGVFSFGVYATDADRVWLHLFDPQKTFIKKVLLERNGEIWRTSIAENLSENFYAYCVERAGELILLSDPWAYALMGLCYKEVNPSIRLASLKTRSFDWQDDKAPQIPLADMVVYEAHVKGLTALDAKVPEALRGRFAALGDERVIERLKDLGVTTLELLPVFAKSEDPFLAPKGLLNYWGYNTLHFFAPEPSYAEKDAVDEFKEMVRALHRAGIEVILDVVFNHTGEGDRDAPAMSFRGLAENSYYRIASDGKYIDFTGCGNTLNTDHPIVQHLILDSLRYWAGEMHVDGFRFDLAPTLFRKGGAVSFDHALHHAIVNDPLLQTKKLIVEPWDLGPEGYQRGKFPLPYLEWNDGFRDAARQFWLREGIADNLAEQILLQGKPSVNFITCHDGFTLLDLVSYEHKHNEANGEENRDGTEENFSHNFGKEGPTTDETILALRLKARKNLIATLLFAPGIPMLLAGDELGNTQHGNNNAYCQDNTISYLDWSTIDAELHDFVRTCTNLRKRITPYAADMRRLPLEHSPRALAFSLGGFLLSFNAAHESLLFSLSGYRVRELLHTARSCHEKEIEGVYLLEAQSVALLEIVKSAAVVGR